MTTSIVRLTTEQVYAKGRGQERERERENADERMCPFKSVPIWVSEETKKWVL